MYKRVKLFLIILGLLLGTTGCVKNRIHFVLPDQFTGAFFLVLDEENGAPPEQEARRITYRLPDNGVLRIESFDPFREVHSLSAAYRSGEKITFATSQTPKNQLALRTLATFHLGDAPPVMVYLIGTELEKQEMRQELLGSRLKEILKRDQ